MIIDFPVYYGVRGRPIGRRQIRSFSFVEHVRSEIRSVSEHEAPVAATWPQPTCHANAREFSLWSNQGRSDPDGRQMTRWFEGRHWKRALLGDVDGFPEKERAFLPALNRQLIQTHLVDGAAYSAFGLDSPISSVHRARPSDGTPGERFDEIVSSDRERRLFLVKRALERSIAVDGELYVACLEPSIVVSSETRPGTNVLDMSFETSTKALAMAAQRVAVTSVVPMTEFERAIALSSPNPAAAAAHAEWFDEIRPTVHLPEAFGTDWQKYQQLGRHLYFQTRRAPQLPSGDLYLINEAIWDLDPVARCEAMETLSAKLDTWRDMGCDVHQFVVAMDLLDDREITVALDVPGPRSLRRP